METCRKYTKLHDKIKDIKTAMLTTTDKNGSLRSMPMTTMQTECEGNVWFFTNYDSEKVDEIREQPFVNLSYTDIHKNIFVSISGHAEIVCDKHKIEELWKPVLEEWFPAGLNDPNIALLKVHMNDAEYWDAEQAKMHPVWSHDESEKVNQEHEKLHLS